MDGYYSGYSPTNIGNHIYIWIVTNIMINIEKTYIYIYMYIYCIYILYIYIYGYQYWMVDHYSGYSPNFLGRFSGFRWEIRPLISGVFKAFPLEVVQLRAPFFNMFLICLTSPFPIFCSYLNQHPFPMERLRSYRDLLHGTGRQFFSNAGAFGHRGPM
jgi:hypothetical protein